MPIKNIDKLNENIYNIRDEIYLDANMSISEQIKVLCVRSNISMAELARRIGLSPQSFSAKMKRESFTIAELDVIADAVLFHLIWVNNTDRKSFILEFL